MSKTSLLRLSYYLTMALWAYHVVLLLYLPRISAIEVEELNWEKKIVVALSVLPFVLIVLFRNIIHSYGEKRVAWDLRPVRWYYLWSFAEMLVILLFSRYVTSYYFQYYPYDRFWWGLLVFYIVLFVLGLCILLYNPACKQSIENVPDKLSTRR